MVYFRYQLWAWLEVVARLKVPQIAVRQLAVVFSRHTEFVRESFTGEAGCGETELLALGLAPHRGHVPGHAVAQPAPALREV